MKFNFRKVTAIATSVLLTGMTVGTAMAAGLAPADIGTASEIAVVYGTGVGVSALDQTQALNIESHLKAQMGSTGSVTAGTVKLTEDEVVLGTAINTTGTLPSTMKQNKLSTLTKEKLSWDDGTAQGTQEYDVHEEIGIVDSSKVITTIDDKKLDGVALTNENALEYKLVFDDALNVTQVGDADADTLYLTIMGKEYEIDSMTATSITVVTSTEKSMTVGEKYTLSNGKSVTLTDVYSTNVEVSVDGTTKVVASGSTIRVNGVRVHVESIGYHENTPETSKAILKIGEDISKSYSDGDEYIGQDSDDPLWVWDISTLNVSGGYIGVKYNAKINTANDEVAGDSIKYIGNGYTFPDNYAAVTLDGVTAAAYQDVKVYFEDSVDLFAASDTSAASVEDVPVLVIEAENQDTITVATHETNKVYVYFNGTAIQTYYNDVDGDYTPTGKMRLANANVVTLSTVTGANTELATLSIGDTDLDVDLGVSAGIPSLTITNDDYGNNAVVNLTIGGTLLNATASAGTLERLGATVEDANALDIVFNGTDVSTQDYDYMDHYGIYLAKGDTAQANADADEVVLSVPEEQVYAKVSVSMGATVTGSTGSMVFKDTETASYANKNVVIVGGSCINAAAAEALGVAAGTCGSAFTAATNVASGQFLIKKTTLGGKNAVVVAGYEADDTVKAAQALINKGVMPGVYTTTTQEVVTA